MVGFSKRKILEEYLNIYNEYAGKYNKIALLYRLGDFYEFYGICDKKLGNVEEVCHDIGLTLTRANKNIQETSPDNPNLAGFNVYCLEEKIEALVKYGYTVVIYEQRKINDRQFERYLSKIIPPASYTGNLQDIDYALMACCYTKGKVHNISIFDFSTNKVECLISNNIKHIEKYFKSKQPKEILWVPSNEEPQLTITKRLESVQVFEKISYQNEFFAKIYHHSELLTPIESLNLEKEGDVRVSLVYLLNYINQLGEGTLKGISKPKIIKFGDTLDISSKTLEQLNILDSEREQKSLFDILNKTQTAGGKRLLRLRLGNPIISPKRLNQRYQELECLDTNTIELVREHLKGIIDLERYQKRFFDKDLQYPQFCTLLKNYERILKILNFDLHKNIIRHLDKKSSELFRKFVKVCFETFDVDKLETFNGTCNIFHNNKEIQVCVDKLNQSLSTLTDISNDLSSRLGGTGMVKLEYTSTDGYHFVTTKNRYTSLKLDKSHFIVKNCTNYVKLTNTDTKKLSELIAELKESIISETKNCYTSFIETNIKYKPVLSNIEKYVSYLDMIANLRWVFDKYEYTKPVIEFTNVSHLNAEKLRHPILERISDEYFVPNNFQLRGDGVLLYGVNGSGKSICLKSVGICVILAQAGFYVPSQKFEFYPFNTLITKVSMSDNLYKGQSTFTCEMLVLKEMLASQGPSSLFLADELCSGTETNSAISIVTSTLLSLTKTSTNFLFTTHLHQLQLIEELKSIRSQHLSVVFENGKVVYGRTLIEGSGSTNYGIDIAKVLGVGDDEFIMNAIRIRRDIEGESSLVVETKMSKYNKNVYVDKCEKCGSRINLQTHHKKPQCIAKNGIIEGQHKNIKANLMVLCVKCHNAEHHQ